MSDLFGILQWAISLLFELEDWFYILVGQYMLFVFFAVFPVLILNRGMIKTFKRNTTFATLCLIFLFPIWIIWSIVELFTDEINVEIEKNKPTKMKYIGVFLLAEFFRHLLILILVSIFILILIFAHWDFFPIIRHLLGAAIAIYAFIFIYNIFDTLNIKKVFPYIVGFHVLRTLIGMGEHYISHPYDAEITYYLYKIMSLSLIIYIIRDYYMDKPDRWH